MEINKEELYKKYIVENMSRKEVAKYFNISENRLRTYLNNYNIKKDKTLSSINMKKTLIDTYSNKKDEIVRKRQSTCITKYGVDNPAKSNIVKDKYYKTISTRDLYIDINRIKEDWINTDITLNELSIKYNISKNHLTYLLTKNNIHKDRLQVSKSIKRILTTKYGRPAMNYAYKLEELSDRNSFIKYLNTFKRKQHLYEIAGNLNISYTSVANYIHKYNLEDYVAWDTSRLEDMFKDLLDKYQLKYEQHNRKEIKPYELDFYLPDYNIAFEINDFATHLDREDYHEMKRRLCREKGIDLYFIWENQLIDKGLYRILEEDLLTIISLYI